MLKNRLLQNTLNNLCASKSCAQGPVNVEHRKEITKKYQCSRMYSVQWFFLFHIVVFRQTVVEHNISRFDFNHLSGSKFLVLLNVMYIILRFDFKYLFIYLDIVKYQLFKDVAQSSTSYFFKVFFCKYNIYTIYIIHNMILMYNNIIYIHILYYNIYKYYT